MFFQVGGWSSVLNDSWSPCVHRLFIFHRADSTWAVRSKRQVRKGLTSCCPTAIPPTNEPVFWPGADLDQDQIGNDVMFIHLMKLQLASCRMQTTETGCFGRKLKQDFWRENFEHTCAVLRCHLCCQLPRTCILWQSNAWISCWSALEKAPNQKPHQKCGCPAGSSSHQYVGTTRNSTDHGKFKFGGGVSWLSLDGELVGYCRIYLSEIFLLFNKLWDAPKVRTWPTILTPNAIKQLQLCGKNLENTNHNRDTAKRWCILHILSCNMPKGWKGCNIVWLRCLFLSGPFLAWKSKIGSTCELCGLLPLLKALGNADCRTKKSLQLCDRFQQKKDVKSSRKTYVRPFLTCRKEGMPQSVYEKIVGLKHSAYFATLVSHAWESKLSNNCAFLLRRSAHLNW